MPILYLLGFLWALPVTLPFALVYLLLWATDQVMPWEWRSDFILVWQVVPTSWLDEVLDGWRGTALGSCILVTDRPTGLDWNRTLDHEVAHCYQWMIFSWLLPVLYALFAAFIWVVLKSLHAYYDNPFERWARRRAGQQMNIPKEQWAHGPEDRWAWW